MRNAVPSTVPHSNPRSHRVVAGPVWLHDTALRPHRATHEFKDQRLAIPGSDLLGCACIMHGAVPVETWRLFKPPRPRNCLQKSPQPDICDALIPLPERFTV